MGLYWPFCSLLVFNGVSTPFNTVFLCYLIVSIKKNSNFNKDLTYFLTWPFLSFSGLFWPLTSFWCKLIPFYFKWMFEYLTFTPEHWKRFPLDILSSESACCSRPGDQYVTITTLWDTYTDLDSSQFVQYHVRLSEDGGNLYFFT